MAIDNHGGKCICFHGLKLSGADERIRKLLKENVVEKYTEDFIVKVAKFQSIKNRYYQRQFTPCNMGVYRKPLRMSVRLSKCLVTTTPPKQLN